MYKTVCNNLYATNITQKKNLSTKYCTSRVILVKQGIIRPKRFFTMHRPLQQCLHVIYFL